MSRGTTSPMGFARTMALTGSLSGIAAALVLGGSRLGLFSSTRHHQAFNGGVGDLTFLAAYLIPAGLALFAIGLRNPAQQLAIWLGVAILSLLGAVATFSYLSLALLPIPGMLLLVASVSTSRVTSPRYAFQILVVSLGILLVGSSAWLALFSRQDIECSVLMRYADGHTAWVQDTSIIASVTETIGPSGEHTLSGGASFPPLSPSQSGPIGSRCTSDTITPSEAAMSLGWWAIGLVGLAWVLPRWGAPLRAAGGRSLS